MRKETVDIDICITFRNSDRKMKQSIRTTSRLSSKIKKMDLVEPVQMNIYESNSYRKDLSWLHFSNEPRVQEKVKVASEVPAVLHYLTTPSNS